MPESYFRKTLVSDSKFGLYAFARKGAIKQLRYPLHNSSSLNWISHLREAIMVHARKYIEEMCRKTPPRNTFRWNLGLQTIFAKTNDSGVISEEPRYSPTKSLESLNTILDIDSRMEEAFQTITSKIDEYENDGSGWMMCSSMHLDMYIMHINDPIGIL